MRCRRAGKGQTEGKLKPWLAKRHGLDGLVWACGRGCTSPRLGNALEPRCANAPAGRAQAWSRLDTGVRAFAADPPPARWPSIRRPPVHRQYARDPAQVTRPAQAERRPAWLPLLNDWLEGVCTAPSLDEALAAARGKLTHGELVMTPEGHAVSQFSVTFYAPDSEQAGMLARAQEIEQLELAPGRRTSLPTRPAWPWSA